MSEKGVFPDVIGINFHCGTVEGFTTAEYIFTYDLDKDVTFSIGGLEVGRTKGKPLMTICDLVPFDTPEFDPKLVNRARLLYSLAPGQGFESPILVDEQVHKVVNAFAARIDLDSRNTSDLDSVLFEICSELKLAPKSVAHTRNHLRREAAGFKVLRDIEIPAQDNTSVLGDLYLPIQHQLGKKYPVLVSCTLYGRRIYHSGPDLGSQEEICAFEKAEDDWHSTSSDVAIEVPRDSWGDSWDRQRGFENIATFNTFSYVPHGYAMLKIDPPGVSQTPGTRNVPGAIAAAFRGAVEWASDQKWSNGNVALVGSSYGANTQWAVASLRPKGLKCFVPYATDLDSYRDAIYPGGIPTARYITDWFSRVQKSSPKWKDHASVVDLMNTHPFCDPLWEMTSHRPNQDDLPCFLAAPQIFIIHGRGAYEAWRVRSRQKTHLQLVDCNYYTWPSHEASGKILQFLGQHLKGFECANLEKVGIQMRLGWKNWYWRKESNWPVPGTEYVKWYLTAHGTLSNDKQSTLENQFTYSSKPPTTGKSGVSFYSSPFEHTVEFAGHFATKLSISATTADADVVTTLWAVSEDGRVVPYGSSGQFEPIAKGFLRASHRKLDPVKTLPERPWHTHTKEDNQLLQPGEIAELEIELFPAAARVCKGWRLRLDVSPSEDQPDIPDYRPTAMRTWYWEGQNEGMNTIHVASGRDNYVLCPVVPVKQGYPRVIL